MDKIWFQMHVLKSLQNYGAQWLRIALSTGSIRLDAFLNLKTEAEPTFET